MIFPFLYHYFQRFLELAKDAASCGHADAALCLGDVFCNGLEGQVHWQK